VTSDSICPASWGSQCITYNKIIGTEYLSGSRINSLPAIG